MKHGIPIKKNYMIRIIFKKFDLDQDNYFSNHEHLKGFTIITFDSNQGLWWSESRILNKVEKLIFWL